MRVGVQVALALKLPKKLVQKAAVIQKHVARSGGRRVDLTVSYEYLVLFVLVLDLLLDLGFGQFGLRQEGMQSKLNTYYRTMNYAVVLRALRFCLITFYV